MIQVKRSSAPTPLQRVGATFKLTCMMTATCLLGTDESQSKMKALCLWSLLRLCEQTFVLSVLMRLLFAKKQRMAKIGDCDQQRTSAHVLKVQQSSTALMHC